ncbi:AMP-binding protein [Meiothermus sp.]|uniref:AMP-binding protein n=1 Tax=Meiothermus sp. TaxID=1955249 RepID=UPI00260C1698|nr:AMP-binding protein [Meiothermus sp.]
MGTGLLEPNPLWALLQLGGCWLRFGGSLYTLAAWSAWRNPHGVALVEPGRSLTFAELQARADRLALLLQKNLKGQTVGLLCRNSMAFVETLLACGRLGADVVLLNTRFGPEQLSAVFGTKKIDLLVCDGEFRERLRGTANAPAQILCAEDLSALSSQAVGRLSWGGFGRKPGSLVILTSGTTGPAKMVRRRPSLSQLLHTVPALLEQLRPQKGAPTLLTVPLLHGHGLATLGLSLAMGAPLYLFPSARAEDFLRCIETNKIAVVVLVPTILYRLLQVVQPHDTGSIHTIVCGSAPLEASLSMAALKRFGPVLFNLYGSSEAGLISLATPQDLLEAPGTVGRVLSGVGVQLLRDDGTEAAPPEPGQVWVRSGWVRDGRFNTRDIGYFDANGRLFLLGRADDLLVIGGEKVYPQTLEETVCAQLRYVQECAVVGQASPEWGQSYHLFVVLKSEVSVEQIAQDLEALFPRSLRPAQITRVDALPRNLAGKIMRCELVSG